MRRFVPLLLLAFATPVHANAEWRAERVNGPVYLMVENGDRTLEDGQRVDPLAEFSLADELAALTLLTEGSRVRSRGPSALRLFGIADEGMPVARVQLTTGSTRIDARPPLDLRVNAGDLRSRTTDGEAWIETSNAGDTVCALRGVIEVQTPGSIVTHELSRTGECVRIDRDGRVSRIRPDSATLNDWLARADGGLNPLSPALVEPAAAVEVAAPAPTPVPAAAPAPAPAPAAIPSPASGGWYVVVGAFDDRTRASDLVRRLEGQGRSARVLAASESDMMRVGVGGFASRAEAEAERERLRSEFSGLWLLQH